MLNKTSKFALVGTSLAPICVTLWFVTVCNKWNETQSFFENVKVNWHQGWEYLLTAVLMTAVCYMLIRLAGKKLEKLPIQIKAVKTVDKEIVGFLLVYLLPLINQSTNTVSIPVLIFIAIIFFIIIHNSHAYHFNPLLGFFGFHFYEVTIEGDITYVLITRRKISDCKSISQVVQLTEYMILEAKGEQ
ncbi:hypothetical protein GF389_00060 [Candidatus Dojkabacteria bacterium]|nr:hypothetical protein [Candidatus Dojkabacteria bacterium]